MWPFKRKGGKTEQIQEFREKNKHLRIELYTKSEEVKQLAHDDDISIKIFQAIRRDDGGK